MFEYKILNKERKSKARVGEFETPHGKLLTPELAIVATDGYFKSVPKEKVKNLPIKYEITNTFHTFMKNIVPKIEKAGGINKYLGYKNVTSTDSGGFQVFSLGFGKVHRVGKLATFFSGTPDKTDDNSNPLKITEEGTEFDFDGKKIKLTPEKSMEIQSQIGADINFAFDECTSPLNSYKYTKKALGRTHRWLERCVKVKKKNEDIRFERLGIPSKTRRVPTGVKNVVSSFFSKQQALFGIVQGGHFEDLRVESAKFVGKKDVDGFGIGGSLGRSKDDMYNILEWIMPHLPDEKPRHLLGIGQVRDIFEAVERGVDLFDCVIPTREARHKVLYTKNGRVNLRKMKNLEETIEKDCKCEACSNNLTLKQLYSLFLAKDPMAFYYSTVHNVNFFTGLMKEIRDAIAINKLNNLKEKYFKVY